MSHDNNINKNNNYYLCLSRLSICIHNIAHDLLLKHLTNTSHHITYIHVLVFTQRTHHTTQHYYILPADQCHWSDDKPIDSLQPTDRNNNTTVRRMIIVVVFPCSLVAPSAPRGLRPLRTQRLSRRLWRGVREGTRRQRASWASRGSETKEKRETYTNR